MTVCNPGGMSYRPYPNLDRALAQLDRGRRPEPPSKFHLHLAGQANAAMEAAGRALEPFARSLARMAEPQDFPVDEYRLSTH